MYCVIVLTCPLTCSTTDSTTDHSCVAFSNCCCSTAFLTASAALLTSARPASSSSDCTQRKSRLRPPSQWRHTVWWPTDWKKSTVHSLPWCRGTEPRLWQSLQWDKNKLLHYGFCGYTPNEKFTCFTLISECGIIPRMGGLLYWNPVWYWPRGEIQESPSATPAKLHFTFPCPTACVSEKEEN